MVLKQAKEQTTVDITEPNIKNDLFCMKSVRMAHTNLLDATIMFRDKKLIAWTKH